LGELIRKEIKDIIEEFITSKVNYSEVSITKENVMEVYNSIKEYILKNDLPFSVLRCQNKIFLSLNKIEFEQLYEVIKRFSTLSLEKGVLEIWEDKENKLLHVVFPSVRRHFIVRYLDEEDKLHKTNSIIYENPS